MVKFDVQFQAVEGLYGYFFVHKSNLGLFCGISRKVDAKIDKEIESNLLTISQLATKSTN